MKKSDCLDRFDKLNIWSKGDERAPHKPLLVLYALGRWQNGQTQISFEEAMPTLVLLLKEFGPYRKTYHPEHPFWHLQGDGIWRVEGSVEKREDQSPSAKQLRVGHAVGSFSSEVIQAFEKRPTIVSEIAQRMLESHFPSTYHSDILGIVGLDADLVISKRIKRDSSFRNKVLTAYEYRCAVCGMDLRLSNVTVGLDAAHIKWHNAFGPDTPNNGLALCTIHHKLFDLGVFMLSDECIFLLSNFATGSDGFEETLARFHGRAIRKAQRTDWLPEPGFLAWHRKEVFKGDPREI